MAIASGEFELIERYFAPLAGEGAFGFKDDAAKIKPSPGCSLVITQDALCEAVHFNPDDPPNLIAQKALRVNLSDLIAKGAKPRWFSLALGLKPSCTEDWISGFATGLAADIDAFDLQFTGGDLSAAPANLFISVTMIGEVPDQCYRSRLGAEAGDLIYMTGHVGDAYLGLALLAGRIQAASDDDKIRLIERYHLPQPRARAMDLVRTHAKAAMDISDGLVADLEKLCRASSVSAIIELDTVPLSAAAYRIIEQNAELMPKLIGGGDDYEVLMTIDPRNKDPLEAAAQAINVEISRIGEIVVGSGDVSVVDSGGNPVRVSDRGYSHFS